MSASISDGKLSVMNGDGSSPGSDGHLVNGGLNDLPANLKAPIGLDVDEVLVQLQQKEKDLILAAELGKALLERNEELSRANEKITEDYSHKLEVSQ